MRTRNKLLTMLILTAGAASITALINRGIQFSAISKHLLEEKEALSYKWRLGTVSYTKEGSGKPLLLIHDLDAAASGCEWSKLSTLLAQSYTVYTIDLLGCGRSEKPNLTYTNYLYVQLISDFIKSEIGHRSDVIATGFSSSIAVMACKNAPELFDSLLLINPESLFSSSLIPGKNAKLYKFILDLPIVGTLIYNISSSKKAILRDFEELYYADAALVETDLVNRYHESAHLGDSPKSVYASVKCSYTKCNIVSALRRIDNSIYLIGGEALPDMEQTLEEYKDCNPAIEYTLLPQSKGLPQLECPEALCECIRTYLG